MRRLCAVITVTFACAISTGAKEPERLRVDLVDEAGQPTSNGQIVAVEKYRLSSALRSSLESSKQMRFEPKEIDQLAKDLDGVTVWLIWDKLPRPADAQQLMSARIELRNVGSLRGKNIKLRDPEGIKPVAGTGEQALLCNVVVGIDLMNGRSLDIGDGVKALSINIHGGIKQLGMPPGIYPKPTTGPAPTTQLLETY